jgi:hypothetical protein
MSNSELIKKVGFSGNVMMHIIHRKYISLVRIERICRVPSCGVMIFWNLLMRRTREQDYSDFDNERNPVELI